MTSNKNDHERTNQPTHNAALRAMSLEHRYQRQQIAALMILRDLGQHAVAEVFQMYQADLCDRQRPLYKLTPVK